MHNPFDLAEILRCCVLLEVLDLRALGDNNEPNYDPRPNILTFNDSNNGDNAGDASSNKGTRLQGLRLRQFRAHNAQASFSTLRRLIDATPDLRVFSFHAWLPVRRWLPTLSPIAAIDAQLLSKAECQLLYGHIASVCPSIRHVQYSVPGRVYHIEDFRSWVSTLPPQVEWCLNDTDLTFGERNEDDGIELPMVHPSDASKCSNRQTLFDRAPAMARLRYLCITVNRLTSLEIHAMCVRNPRKENFVLAEALHFFLCSSPSLVHLKTPYVFFFTEYLDFSPHTLDITSEWWSSQRCMIDYWSLKTEGTEQGEQPSRQRCRPIWACRGLQTLNITFRNCFGQARTIFGYISLVCPQLRELSIRQSYLSLGLKGGMCMLARLRWLERLSIQSNLEPKPKFRSKIVEQEWDIWWLKIMIARKKTWDDPKGSGAKEIRRLRDMARQELKQWRNHEPTQRFKKVGSHVFSWLQDKAKEAELLRYYDRLEAGDRGEMAIIQALTRMHDSHILTGFTESLLLKGHIPAEGADITNQILDDRSGQQHNGTATDDCVWPRLQSLDLTYRDTAFENADELIEAMRQLRPEIRITIQGKKFVEWVYE